MKRAPLEEQAATLRVAAYAQTVASPSDSSGRAGALSALARPAALLRGVRLLSYALLGAVIGVVVLAAAATLPVFFGYHTYIVYGGSMAPALKAGSVAVSKATSPQELSVGDIIARRASPDSPAVLHRIVDITIVDGQHLFVTQGDQNNSPDSQPVALRGAGDRVIYSVPYAGYILHYAGSGLGRLLLIGLPLASFAVMRLRDAWRKPRREAGSGTGAGEGEEPSPRDATTEKEYRDAA